MTIHTASISGGLNCHPNNRPDNHTAEMDSASTAAKKAKPSSGLLNLNSQSILPASSKANVEKSREA